MIPVALGGVFDQAIAKKVNAKAVLEASNLPTFPDGDYVFQEKGILIVPDVLAYAVGVVVSYVEWVQNRQQYRWNADQVTTELENHLFEAYREMWNFSQKNKLTYRIASFILGVSRVAEAERLRGP